MDADLVLDRGVALGSVCDRMGRVYVGFGSG